MPVRTVSAPTSNRVTAKRIPVAQPDVELSIPYASAVILLKALAAPTFESEVHAPGIGAVLAEIEAALLAVRVTTAG